MPAVEIRIARDDEIEATVALRWRWTSEHGDDDAQIDEQAFVAEAAVWPEPTLRRTCPTSPSSMAASWGWRGSRSRRASRPYAAAAA